MRGQFYHALLQDRFTLQGVSLTAMVAVYFALSNIWGGAAGKPSSMLTHELYLIIFTLLESLALQNLSRHAVMIAMITGVTLLSVFTIATDAGKVIYFVKSLTSIPVLAT